MSRMRRLLVPLSMVLMAFALVAPSAQADDGYTSDIPTSCNIDVPGVAVGDRVALRISVSANTTEPVTGDVDLVISTAAARARAARSVGAVEVWTKTVRYEGTPLRVLGPRLPRGAYIVKMTFTPDDGLLTGCTNTARFRVGGGQTGGVEDPDGSDGLPNTGGPHLYLLVLGLGLVAGGSGLVGRSRLRARRTV